MGEVNERPIKGSRFLFERVEYRKREALARRDRWPSHTNDWYFWDGKVSAYRSIANLIRKGPRLQKKEEAPRG